MNRPGGYGHSLPRLETQGSTLCQVDEKATLDDQEELVRGWMMVPGVISVEDRESKAVLVHAVDNHVAVAFRHLSALSD